MNNNFWLILIVLLFVAFSVIMEIMDRKKRDAAANELMKTMATGDYDQFEKLTQEKRIQRYIPAFNLDFMKFNAAILQGKKEKSFQIYDSFADKRLNSKQKMSVLMRGMGCFVIFNDPNRCRDCYEKIKAMPDQGELLKQVQPVYDIMVLKKTDGLDELLKKVETDQDSEKVMDEFLLASCYENTGDQQKADQYRKDAEEKMKGTSPKD